MIVDDQRLSGMRSLSEPRLFVISHGLQCLWDRALAFQHARKLRILGRFALDSWISGGQ